MIRSPNQKLPTRDLLEMAFHAQVGVADRKQLRVDRAVGRVTNRAAFAGGFMLEHIRATLAGMAAKTTLVLRKSAVPPRQSGPE